jgi:cyclic-di-GMP-binding protein
VESRGRAPSRRPENPCAVADFAGCADFAAARLQSAAMPSFDIVSKLDPHELTNAVDQANRELDKRFDFRGANASFEFAESVVTLRADAEFRLKQMQEILMQRLAARGVDVRCAEIADPEINLAAARQKIMLKQGIDQALAKKIVKLLKDAALKVQAQIQGDQLRVSGKKRDDLQIAIAFLRKSEIDMPLQFENFRD